MAQSHFRDPQRKLSPDGDFHLLSSRIMLIGSSDFEEKKLIDEDDWVNLSVVMHGAGMDWELLRLSMLSFLFNLRFMRFLHVYLIHLGKLMRNRLFRSRLH